MFIGWKDIKYCLNFYTQRDLQIHGNPHQIFNDIFQRYKKNTKSCKKPQKKKNSKNQAIFSKKNNGVKQNTTLITNYGN